MDFKAKNSITDRVQFTGRTIVNDEAWINGTHEQGQSEGHDPEQAVPVSYVGPERRQRRAQHTPALSRSA
jgi:hypothetical protein